VQAGLGAARLHRLQRLQHRPWQRPTRLRRAGGPLRVYFPPTEDIFLAPIDAVAATEGRLRFEPPRNNQRKRIRMAADFEIDTWTERRFADLAAAARAPAA
jgi:hypothetical protein